MKTSKTKFSVKLPAVMLAVCACFLPYRGNADVARDMANMFNSMGTGAQANYTSGGAYFSQAGAHFEGGSLSVRTPVSTFTPVNIELPRLEAGCGGIDLYMGSMSFPSGDEFLAMVRNLGNNIPGVAFDLAISALDPMIGDAIKGIRKMVQDMNQFSLNSCEAAKRLVGGAAEMLGSSMQQGCQAEALKSGITRDSSQSRFHCQAGKSIVDAANKVRGRSGGGNTFSFTGGNLTFEILKKYYKDQGRDIKRELSDSEFNLYVSLMGTVLQYPAKEIPKDPNSHSQEPDLQIDRKVLPPTIADVKTLLDLPKGAANAGTATTTMTAELWVCTGGEGTTASPKPGRMNCAKREGRIYSIPEDVRKNLTGLADAIRNETPLTTQTRNNIIKYINNTRVPILKIAVADAVNRTNDLLSDEVIKAISAEYLVRVFGKIERELMLATGGLDRLDKATEEHLKGLQQNLNNLRFQLSSISDHQMTVMEKAQNYKNTMARLEAAWRERNTQTNNSFMFDSIHRF